MFYLIVTIIISAASVVLTLIILMQQSKTYGLSASIGGANPAQDTYLGRNKRRTKEGKLVRWTVVLAVVFYIAAILLNVGLFTGM